MHPTSTCMSFMRPLRLVLVVVLACAVALVSPTVPARGIAAPAVPPSTPSRAPAVPPWLSAPVPSWVTTWAPSGGTALSDENHSPDPVGRCAPECRWQWPLPGAPSLDAVFDPPDDPWGAGHRGVDLVGSAGDPVMAVEDGTVTFSGVIAGVGMVSITHSDGLRSTYQPVEDRVAEGIAVTTGQELGRLGSTGSHCPPRDCLHLGAVRGDRQYEDPLDLLGLARPVILLPLGGAA